MFSIFSLLEAKYKSRSDFLLKVDFLFKISFLITSEFFEPPGSLILINFFAREVIFFDGPFIR